MEAMLPCLFARLMNHGPHLDCYRGLVRLHDDGRLTWASSGLAVEVWHEDYLVNISCQLTAQ